MQAERFTHLSLFKIYKYVSRQGEICDFLHAPRPCFFLAAILSGSAVFESNDGEKFRADQGDIIFIPKGAKYRSFWGEFVENVYISLRFDFEPFCGFPDPETLMLQKVEERNTKNLSERMREAYLLSQQTESGGTFALSVFYEALSALTPALKRAKVPMNDRRLSPAIDYIRAHLDEDTPASILAALCHMSEPNLYLLFRRQLSESPVEYKNRLRIERAQQLLLSHPDMPIEQIADAAGFESAAYFRRRFKEATGESPRDYRKRETEKL